MPSTASTPPLVPNPSARRIRFGLRGLLFLVLLLSVGFAWAAYQQRRVDARRAFVQTITRHGGTVLTDQRPAAWQRYVWGPAADGAVLQVDLYGTQASPEILAGLAAFSELTYLDLSHVPITDADLPRLAGLTRLRVLYLAHTSITDAGLASLRSLDNLYELDLTGTAVTAEAAAQLQADLPHVDVTR